MRTPLPNTEAERIFYKNMMTVAEAQERKADLLADPNTSLLQAYETQIETIAQSFRRRLRTIAGENYEEIAMSYYRGDRNDRIGELASYYFEGLWRMQQRTTVTDMLFFPIIIRYPDCFTVNIRFASGYKTTESILYESPEHSLEAVDDEYAATYYNDCNYSQKQAAEYTRKTARIIREQFPDPDETSFEGRKYGGIVSAGGRRGTTFSSMLKAVEPDPDRFSDEVTVSTLVEEGPEAKRTEAELLCGCEVLI